MDARPDRPFPRRELLRLAALAAMADPLGASGSHASGEPPPETPRIRLIRIGGICLAPQYVAEELLRAEGFTDVQYLSKTLSEDVHRALAVGEADISMWFVAPLLREIEAGNPLVMLAGIHPGCHVLFGTDRVQTIRDLKGRTVAVPAVLGAHHLFVASMASYVGLDAQRDIRWAVHPRAEAMRLLAEGQVDAYLGFPPDPQEMRAKRIGQVVVSTTKDRPWSQYFCCAVAGNRGFVRRHPVATKRALRALLKASLVCTTEPERVARTLVDRGFAQSYDYALQTLRELPYGRWREYSAEDTVRFWALRLREAGLITSLPQRILADGTDWRFLNELKRELKG